MDKPDDKCAPRQCIGMAVIVAAMLMRRLLVAMAVSVKVRGAKAMVVGMKMDAIAR